LVNGALGVFHQPVNTPTPTETLIVGKHNAGITGGYFLSALTTGQVNFYFNQDANRVATPTTFNDNEWHFLVGTNDGAIGRLYVDGQYIGSNPGTPLDNSRDLTVGGVLFASGSFGAGVIGSIDDVRVYNNALTQAEISQLYTSTTVPVPAAFWLFGSAFAGLIGFARFKDR